MHEGAVCREILLIAEDAAARGGIVRITGITLAVGPRSCVNTSLLQFYFEVAKLGTRAQQAQLTVTRDNTITGARQEYVRRVEGE